MVRVKTLKSKQEELVHNLREFTHVTLVCVDNQFKAHKLREDKWGIARSLLRYVIVNMMVSPVSDTTETMHDMAVDHLEDESSDNESVASTTVDDDDEKESQTVYKENFWPAKPEAAKGFTYKGKAK